MTHLSDYSFVQRAVANGWFYIWYIIYVYRYDRFTALKFKRVARFELRSVVTLILLLAIPLHLSYDIGVASIKYSEGFWVNPANGAILGKPSELWSQGHQDLANVLDYTLATAMAFLASIFFLLQSFYHYISKSVTKSSFMSSLEFRINIVCSIAVVIVFPLIQFFFRNSHNQKEAAPELAFSVVLTCIGILGVRTHYRFLSLLKVALMTISESSQGVAEKLEYFKDMNMVITGAMLGAGISLGIASADGLTPSATIAHNKFASDFLVTNLNFFEFIIWVAVVMIFYPRRSVVGAAFGASSGGSLSRTAPIASARQATHTQNEYVKSTLVNSNNFSAAQRSGRSNNERPPSIVPYKAPTNNHMSDMDTYPLTSLQDHDATDAVQLEAFKSMYDMESAAPISPTSSAKGRFDSGLHFPERAMSPLLNQRPQQQTTTRVGQQTFILEGGPGISNYHSNYNQQQDWQYQDDYNRTVSPPPSSPPKGLRPPPKY